MALKNVTIQALKNNVLPRVFSRIAERSMTFPVFFIGRACIISQRQVEKFTRDYKWGHLSKEKSREMLHMNSVSGSLFYLNISRFFILSNTVSSL